MENNYFTIDGFLNSQEVRAANKEIDDLLKSGKFRPAQVGGGSEKQIKSEIRSDLIHWVDEATASPILKTIFEKIEGVKEKFNREHFLGLWSFEGHYAVYPEGSFYKKHVDQFKNSDSRIMSLILYLNENWQESHGGKLVLHLPHQHPISIDPIGGRLVCFLSQDLPHEVEITSRERRSFTGWFKKRA